MRAVVMAGGKGIRLQPYTRILPKPMLPLGEYPILAWLLLALGAAGITDITLAVHHKGYVFRSYFGDGRRFGVRIRYLQEKEPQGTAGALRLIRGLKEPFLVTNADIVTNCDFVALLRFHRRHDAWMTIATQVRSESSKLGILETDGDRVVAYHEKPVRQERVGIGIYVIDPRALACLPADGPCDMPELIRRLLAEGRPVVHCQTEGLWFDLGSPEQYEEVAARWSELEQQMGRERP
ncbi:MAG: sugar phosphate nucleotidyltransferase [Bacillota bacterium]